MVTERRREIGIRVALGAVRSHVLIQIMKEGLQVTALGVTIGVAGALALNRLIASLLFAVQPADTMTIACVIVTIAAVARVPVGCRRGAQRGWTRTSSSEMSNRPVRTIADASLPDYRITGSPHKSLNDRKQIR